MGDGIETVASPAESIDGPVELGAESSPVTLTRADEPVDVPAAVVAPEPTGLTTEPEYRIETITNHEIEIRIGDRFYRITEFNLKRLSDFSITLKLSGISPGGGETFFISEVNLARAKSRAEFVEESKAWVAFPDEKVRQDLQTLVIAIERLQRENIKSVEQERISMVKTFVFSKDEEAETIRWLERHDVLDGILFEDLERIGYSGDELAKIVLYVAVTSRKLSKPLSVLSVANSSAGKSFGQEVIASLIPDDEVFTFTRLSPKSLSHFGRHDLVHRALFLDEFVGSEDESSSQLRALLSRGSITTGISTVDTVTGKVLTVTKDVFGPIALFSSTTNENKIDDETRSRFLILPIDESEDQTKRVFGTMVAQSTARGILLGDERQSIRRRYRMIQKVLRPIGVVIPEKWRGKIEFNSTRISQKRRFQGYLSFLSAVALHRQYQREIKTLVMPDGRGIEFVEITRDDIVLTNRVIESLYPAAPDDLNPVDRRMLADIEAYCAQKGQGAGVPPVDVPFTRRDIREASHWDPTPCRRTFERLLDLEYIERTFGRGRSRSFYKLAPSGEENESVASRNRLWCPESSESLS